MTNAWKTFIPTLTIVLAGCQDFGGRDSADVVAGAAGVEFPVEAAAEILAPQTQLPNEEQVVEALANLWVDYFLLARVSMEDTTFQTLDLGPLVEQNLNQELVLRLRDQVIQVDTAVTDEELRDLFEADLPGARVRARHILFRFPDDASPAQVDSVRALAESIRERLQAGEDFSALAREYSQDAGSASMGGDLGSFPRGEMVPPFEDVAFSLQEGEISRVVETTFGLHIIRVDERIIPSVEENLDRFRSQVQAERVAAAESTYVANVIDSAEVEVLGEEFPRAREMAREPNRRLSDRELERALVSFRGGELTLGDFREWLLLRGGGMRDQVREATDQQLEGLFRNLARERLLVREARQAGLEVSPARRDSLETVLRQGVKEVSRQLGFMGLRPQEGESLDDAAYRVVENLLTEMVQERRDVTPLGGVSFVLRDQFDAWISPPGVSAAVDRVIQMRRELPSPSPLAPSEAPDTAEADSAGAGG